MSDLTRLILLYSFILFLLCPAPAEAQISDSIPKNDTKQGTLMGVQDSILDLYDIPDSLLFQQDGDFGRNDYPQNIKVSNDTIDAPIEYNSRDSFRVDMDRRVVHLFGQAQVNYKEIELKAERIDYYWEKGEVEAYGVFNPATGTEKGKPEFRDGSDVYLAEHFRYNFKTKKGKSTGMVMKEAEGWLHGVEIKTVGEDIVYGKKAQYTTCEYEDPHFYIEIDKFKAVKDKLIVGKPANLVIEDVRTPIWLPFGIFPMMKDRNSGMIQPQFIFNYSDVVGYGIRDLGVFWAINEKLGLTVKADVYTHGNYNLYALLDYKKRYKINGGFDAMFLSRTTDERRDPDFAGPDRSLSLRWTLNVDPKTLNNSSFTINTNIQTSGFNKNLIGDGDAYLNNTLNSSISYTKNWPTRPVRMSLNANHTQNTSTGQINLTVPSLTLSVSSFNPFGKLGKTGDRKWYQDIYVSYGMRTETRIQGVDSTFFSSETVDGIRSGMRQDASIGTKIRLFKYFNITPSFSYNEYWYPYSTVKTFVDTLVTDGDTTYNQILEERDYGFNTGRDFSLNMNLGWTLYATFNFKNRKHVTALRHVVRPSVSFAYKPDFSDDRWGIYKTIPVNTEGKTTTYSIFEDGIYGGPSAGEQLSLGFSITNDFEMKVATKRDTINQKKIRLFNGLRFSGSYNFARDSIRLSNIGFSSGSTELYKGIRFNFSGVLNPYYTDPATNQTLDRWLVKETGRLFRLTSFNMTFTGTYQSKNRSGNNSSYVTEETFYEPAYEDPYYGNRYDYVDFSIPWSFNLQYNMNLTKRFVNSVDTKTLTHSATLKVDFNLTPKWQINTELRYNFTDMEINSASVRINRDLHCWYMFVEWYPVGRQYINFGIRIKSSQLGSFLNRVEKSIPADGQITNFGYGF